MQVEPLIKKIDYAVAKKTELLQKSPTKYVVRCLLATLYLTLATVTALVLAEQVQKFVILVTNDTNSVTAANVAYNIAKIFYGIFFGWALIMILFMNTELFTSNAMYFSTSLMDRKISLKKAINLLSVCYIGNLIGSIIASALFVYSKTITPDLIYFAEHVVTAKLAKPSYVIFLQGLIANLVVNIAVIMSINLKDELAKIVSILAIVFCFAFLGSEHVVANFSLFALVILENGIGNIEFLDVIKNLFFATIGNIVGGGLIIGATYAWLNQGDFKYKD